jgi:hypothetical protein
MYRVDVLYINMQIADVILVLILTRLNRAFGVLIPPVVLREVLSGSLRLSNIYGSCAFILRRVFFKKIRFVFSAVRNKYLRGQYEQISTERR